MAKNCDDTTNIHALADVFPIAVQAIKSGDVENLMLLLTEHPDLANACSLQGRTLLNHLCDWPGNFPREIESGRVLIDAGADINARAIDPAVGETSLQWAVSSNDVAMAEFLIDSGASVNGLHNDLRPLAQALFYRCIEVAEVLVKRGANMTLEFAAGLGRIDLMQKFFHADGQLIPNASSHTEPINKAIQPQASKNELLEQALIYAVINDKVECAAYLLDQGADLCAMPSGFHFLGTPLHWAAGCDSTTMVEMLVHRGADIHGKTPKDNKTPLDIAIGWKKEEIVQLLIRLGG